MRFGFVVPYANGREFTELAVLGEQHGWDGLFTWESLWGEHAWVVLGAAAMATSTIRLGTLLTPASRWRPWDLASAVGTVDRLSGGRVTMSVGLGAVHEGWTVFEPDEGRQARAEKLDECLAVYDGLMRGQPFSFDGKHYQARPTDHLVPEPPVQRPRPPVWVVGAKVAGRDKQPSLARAARWDGLLPAFADRPGNFTDPTLDQFAALVTEVRELRVANGRADAPYDVVIEGDSSGEFTRLDPPHPASWAAAGATWWVESWWSLTGSAEDKGVLRQRVQAGPPR